MKQEYGLFLSITSANTEIDQFGSWQQHNAQPDITNRPITTSALTMHQSNEMNLKVTHSLT